MDVYFTFGIFLVQDLEDELERVQRTIYRQETGTGDTRELLGDIARLESRNATLQNQLKELENKNFQDNKEKEKVL